MRRQVDRQSIVIGEIAKARRPVAIDGFFDAKDGIGRAYKLRFGYRDSKHGAIIGEPGIPLVQVGDY